MTNRVHESTTGARRKAKAHGRPTMSSVISWLLATWMVHDLDHVA
jgi:hypothetical protein